MNLKNYHSNFITKVQKSINSSKCEITDMQSFDDMPRRIKINGVTINLLMSDENVPSSISQVGEDITSDDFQKWSKTAIGRFYSRDWKASIKKPSTYKLYKFINADLGDNIIANILVRKITEDDVKRLEDFDQLTDVMIGEEHYVIIKAYSLNESDEEYFNYDSIFEERSFDKEMNYDESEHHIDMPSDESFEDIPDDGEDTEESEELF